MTSQLTGEVCLKWLTALQARTPDPKANEFDEVPPTVMYQLLGMIARLAEIQEYVIRGELDRPFITAAADNLWRLAEQEDEQDEDGVIVKFSMGQQRKLR